MGQRLVGFRRCLAQIVQQRSSFSLEAFKCPSVAFTCGRFSAIIPRAPPSAAVFSIPVVQQVVHPRYGHLHFGGVVVQGLEQFLCFRCEIINPFRNGVQIQIPVGVQVALFCARLACGVPGTISRCLSPSGLMLMIFT